MQLVIMVLTGLVDATDSNVGSGGYGFTVKPIFYTINAYFTCYNRFSIYG
jgi:hypothetical protein